MSYSILLLVVSALILLFFTPRSRYSLPILLLDIGIVVILLAVLFQNFSTATYVSSQVLPFRSVDLALYRWIGRMKFSMITTHRIRNIGTVVYLYGINSLLYLISRNVLREKKSSARSTGGWVFFITLFILPLLYYGFYSAKSALYLYVKYFSLPPDGRPLLLSFVTNLDHIIHIVVFAHVFLPVAYVLVEARNRRITYFSETIVILLSIVTVMNIMFLIPFYSSTDGFFSRSVFLYGFWFFGSTGKVSPVYSSFYLLLALATLFFTVATANRIFGSELVLTVRQKTLNASITELNRNMMEVFHSEKNMLFSIQLLMEEAKAGYGTEEALGKLERIDSIVSHRMDTISSSLKRIRELHLHPHATDLRDVADNVLSGLVVSDDVKLERKYCEFPAMCMIDTYHTAEALKNLLMNSFEALQLSQEEDKEVSVTIEESLDWIMLSVSDNGPGIERSMVRRVIMPFTSTKSKNENWGIGLSYVYRVIDAQLGQMRINTSNDTPKTGTRIDILLPRAKEAR